MQHHFATWAHDVMHQGSALNDAEQLGPSVEDCVLASTSTPQDDVSIRLVVLCAEQRSPLCGLVDVRAEHRLFSHVGLLYVQHPLRPVLAVSLTCLWCQLSLEARMLFGVLAIAVVRWACGG